MEQLGFVLARGGHRDALEARLGGRCNRQATGPEQEPDLGGEVNGQGYRTH